MTASASAEPTTAPAPARRSAFTRYVRANPFCVVLAAITIATGLSFGTFFGRFPSELAVGRVTVGHLGHWWALFTGPFIPDSLIAGILIVGLTLTVGAYAERLMGTPRTVLVYVVVGILAELAGLGLQAALSLLGEYWAKMSELDLVADPSLGLVGFIMAASAFAPALFRRRIRLIGMALLVMFVLYAADSNSVYRFAAGVLGIIAGIILHRSRASDVWFRSSYREVRTLVAAMVAVVGLGPFVVLVSGATAAPLGLVISGFTPLDLQEVLNQCQGISSRLCNREIALALTYSPGILLLSLVPVLLALLAAWGLRTGRRSAWLLAIFVNVAITVLTSITLGIIDLFRARIRTTVELEFAIATVLAALVPIATIVVLAITWRHFTVVAPRAARRRFWVTVVSTLVILAAAYIAIGLIDSGAYFEEPPTFGELLIDSVRLFVPAGFFGHRPPLAVPVEGLPLLAFQWFGVVFWLVFTVALLRRYRSVRLHRETGDEERFRALLKQGGGGTLGFMGTWPGNEYWFTPDGDGAVAFRVINRIALTTSDPVCVNGAERETIEGFVHHCEEQGWSACFYSFHEKYLPIFESFGWQWMSVGEETVLDLAAFELTGKAWQKVRQPLNRGLREGITTLWSTWHDLPAHLSAEIEAVSEEWIAKKKLPEMGFTLGGMDELKDPDVGIFLAIDKDGRIEATTSWLPSWTDGKITGWTIDFMRRGDESMPGIMEFIIASAALHMKEQGVQVLSLSGAPLATKPGEQTGDPTVMDGLLSWLGSLLEPAYGFTSLFRFKSKFNPRYDTIYMAYADPAQLATIGMAIGNAYLPHATGKEYLALAQTVTGRGGDH